MSNVFFVLSAGRSGSASLAKYLQYAKNAEIFHEPNPGMQEFLDGYAENVKLGFPFSKRELFEGFRKGAIEAVHKKGLVFGELSPMLSYVAEVMPQVYPDVKFVWLLRDPKTWIRSAAHTNVCDGVFETLCRYWYDINMQIQVGFLKAKPENRCMLRTELLAPRVRYAVYRWLGLGPQHQGARNWMKQDFREHRYTGPLWAPHPNDWAEEEWEAFNEYIKPFHDEILRLYDEEKL